MIPSTYETHADESTNYRTALERSWSASNKRAGSTSLHPAIHFPISVMGQEALLNGLRDRDKDVHYSIVMNSNKNIPKLWL